ncbi:Uncharacterized membrane protein YgdD, TMEM256/DUF423 family [Modicisalibacter ilicicola DSM 19980]|uniref:Uncharacterized membrane protein YgdD, TMEM256/DUF423 family n=1 Tax=Modicisalibacter ilicicola DSM 19980 TaxID=1121942 RepID=A0A1M5AEH9_9GAMM|nr:DUF423 domain-containing protein [Halomonas ilicicola]SHF28710.1 Uncharacterized membrane protein YgdD, TMEM256/DUF423 family [Halomonas ilicicola DSM 19980]
MRRLPGNVDMRERLLWVAAASSGFVMVLAGAFGAHGLEGQVSERLLAAFETGVRYQAWHTLAILLILIQRQQQATPGQLLVLGLWATGILLFSGSLYLMALTGVRALGMITPIGGVSFLAGWLALAAVVWRTRL